MSVPGWKLDPQERERLLRDHPPRYAVSVADHVTLKPFDRTPTEVRAAIVGRCDDERGVEAMVVTIDGSIDRPDGAIYHITWSLAEGREARESNAVLKERGWKELDHPIPITLVPGRV